MTNKQLSLIDKIMWPMILAQLGTTNLSQNQNLLFDQNFNVKNYSQFNNISYTLGVTSMEVHSLNPTH